jgi:DNA-binding GntR family transcriptional regulator
MLLNIALKSSGVHAQLRRDILMGRLAPGQRLIARELAHRFGTSEVPVREALWMLERDGLVEMKVNHGARVVQLTPDEVREAYLIRAHLEGLATETAVPKVDRHLQAQLDEAVSEMGKVVEEGDPIRYADMNRRFHEMIFAASPHRRLHALISNIWDGHGAMRTVFHIASRLRASHHEHNQILDAIRQGDAARAGELARQHKLAVGQALWASLRQQEENAIAERSSSTLS